MSSLDEISEEWQSCFATELQEVLTLEDDMGSVLDSVFFHLPAVVDQSKVARILIAHAVFEFLRSNRELHLASDIYKISTMLGGGDKGDCKLPDPLFIGEGGNLELALVKAYHRAILTVLSDFSNPQMAAVQRVLVLLQLLSPQLFFSNVQRAIEWWEEEHSRRCRHGQI